MLATFYLPFPHELTHRSIALAEAATASLLLQWTMERFPVTPIRLLSDNTPTVGALRKGRSSNPALNLLARDLAKAQTLSACSLEFAHIPGKLNFLADLLSRTPSLTDAREALHSLDPTLPATLLDIPIPSRIWQHLQAASA